MNARRQDRTVLITGGTSGIGAALVTALSARGYEVLATSRAPENIPDSARVPGVRYLPLDLSVPESIAALDDQVEHVDVLINNAGESQSGPFEELPAEAVERLFCTNVFGPLQLSQRVLPHMRRRGHGRIIMVGSMLASFPLAHRSSYVGAKAALRGFATAARQELAPFGVWISVVEPGSIATGIGERRSKYLNTGSAYRADVTTMLEHLDRNEREGIAPQTVAATIIKALEADNPRQFYAVGSRSRLAFALKRVLPRELMSTIVARQHGLKR